MSKSMIQAFAKAQVNALTAKDNKERLRFTIAGCKDGHLFSHDGTDYGLFNEDAPDTEFIPESDLKLSRITGVKITGITNKMNKFFTEYGVVTADMEQPSEDTDEDTDEGATEVETPKEPKTEPTPETEDVNEDAVVDACKKAIKKGNFKKAQKLIDKLPEGSKPAKKLAKKLAKAQ